MRTQGTSKGIGKRANLLTSFLPGDILYTPEHSGVGVYNLATQREPGPDATIHAVLTSFYFMICHAHSRGTKKIKTVRVGSGLGGLDWAEVRATLELISTDIELEVYYF